MTFDPVQRFKQRTSALLRRALQADFNQLATKAELRAAADNVYRQSESLLELSRLLPELSLPPLRRYAISPDSAVQLVEIVERYRPALAVELGSGASTLILASSLLRFSPGSRLISIDHDETFAAATRHLLGQHGIDNTEVRVAPLQNRSGAVAPWYSPDAIADLHDIGFLFVDGPPGRVPNARLPSVENLLPRMAFDCVVVVDDTSRADEATLAAAWATALTGTLEYRDAEKGLAVVVRNQDR